MMDFIILKVNGEDLSSATHDQILKVFKSASDPITVEVARRNHKSSKSKGSANNHMTDLSINIPHAANDSVSPYATTVISHAHYGYDSPQPLPRSNHNDSNFLHSASAILQTQSQQLVNCTDLLKINGIVEEDEDEEEEEVEIIKEEVILRKIHTREIFGLTLSYSALAANDNSESEVYISAIEMDSVASKQPGIRIGDQILQINNIDVHSKAQVVSLFQCCGLEVHMLLGRPNIVQKKNGFNEKSSTTTCDLAPVEEAEYSSVYDDVESCKEKNKYRPQLDKDSGIGRGTDETTKTEESSECDSAHASLRKSSQFSSLDSSQGRVDMQQISLLMQHLALEYHQLQRLLQGPTESPSSRIQALPPPTLNPASSRVVPRMGTRLETPQMKLPNVAPPASSSNTSAYNTSLDSTRSSPLTMELGPTNNSSSLLSLKLDHFSNGRLASVLDENGHAQSSSRGVLNSYAGSDHKSASSSSATDLLDPRMTISSIMTKNSYLDNECHYYDVYDPSTTMNNTNSRYNYDMYDQSLPTNEYIEPDYINASLIRSDKADNKMEWVVKKRPDGTRYITRRPIRNKVLKDRGRKVSEERFVLTTEEEENSLDIKMAKYLCKSDKRKPQDKSKEKKPRRRENMCPVQSDLSTNSPALSRSGLHSLNRSALRDVDNRNISQQRLYNRPTFIVGTTMF